MLPGLPPGRVLATFDGDGGTVESANAAPALRGASHGAWQRIAPNLFAVTRVFFRFNPQTGAYVGTQQVNATVRVAPDGETFTAVSVSELRDPAGNLILGGLRGTRDRQADSSGASHGSALEPTGRSPGPRPGTARRMGPPK